MSSRQSSQSRDGHVEALDFDSNRKPPSSETDRSSLLRDDASLLGNVVDEIVQKDREKMQRQVSRYISYLSAIVSWYVDPAESI